MTTSLKEASETQYWLELLTETNYIESNASKSLLDDCAEIAKMLHATVKTSKLEV
jgi:four helix bundle protein